MKYLKVLIPAAGKGTRSKLNYPKTLFKINNKPILIRILKNTKKIDSSPSIIVSPDGKKLISSTLKKYGYSAELITQNNPTGMGDAVLNFKKSLYYKTTKNILLIWGDIPFIKSSTFSKLINCHLANKNDFTFITGISKKPYTLVKRDKYHKVISVKETKNAKIKVNKGERDIGIFIFNKLKIFNILNENKKYIKDTSKKENNFLYIIEKLIKKGFRVEGLNIADNKEMISFNQFSDLNNRII